LAARFGLLVVAGQSLFSYPGQDGEPRLAGTRGEGKTDAWDAAIIVADQARMCRDLHPLPPTMRSPRS